MERTVVAGAAAPALAPAPHPWANDLDDSELQNWQIWEEVKRSIKRHPEMTPPTKWLDRALEDNRLMQRFRRAANGSIVGTAMALLHTARWRDREGVNDILKTWRSDAAAGAVRAYWPACTSGKDRHDQPVLVCRLGCVDWKALQAAGQFPLALRHSVFLLEHALRSRSSGDSRVTLVCDLGCSRMERPRMPRLCSAEQSSGCLDFLRALFSTLRQHYPYRIKHLLVVRPPPHFWAVWSIARAVAPSWLEDTMRVFQEVRAAQKALLHMMSIESVPECLGGLSREWMPKGGLLGPEAMEQELPPPPGILRRPGAVIWAPTDPTSFTAVSRGASCAASFTGSSGGRSVGSAASGSSGGSSFGSHRSRSPCDTGKRPVHGGYAGDSSFASSRGSLDAAVSRGSLDAFSRGSLDGLSSSFVSSSFTFSEQGSSVYQTASSPSSSSTTAPSSSTAPPASTASSSSTTAPSLSRTATTSCSLDSSAERANSGSSSAAAATAASLERARVNAQARAAAARRREERHKKRLAPSSPQAVPQRLKGTAATWFEDARRQTRAARAIQRAARRRRGGGSKVVSPAGAVEDARRAKMLRSMLMSPRVGISPRVVCFPPGSPKTCSRSASQTSSSLSHTGSAEISRSEMCSPHMPAHMAAVACKISEVSIRRHPSGL